MAVSRVEAINPEILRQCREQMGISVEEARKKVHTIIDIENGNKKPTFNQINTLSSLYGVPRWVFISDSLPEQYQLNQSIPAFRQFLDSPEVFNDHKIRRLVATIEELRELVLEIRNEIDDPITEFSAPNPRSSSIESVAREIRTWLNVNREESFDFKGWRKKLEEKDIFIFLSAKYNGWSHIDKEVFRGLSIYHPIFPIIIINDSDSRKAQSFTLFHELGHLLYGEDAINSWRKVTLPGTGNYGAILLLVPFLCLMF